MTPDSPPLTELLREASNGNRAALDQLVPRLYQELRHLAHRRLQQERQDHTLSTTALVHEAYLKLIDQERVAWRDRAHFFGVAAQMMRRILIDYARTAQRLKRGGGQVAVALEDDLVAAPDRSAEVLAIDEALTRLARLDPQQARVVECRFFGGMTVEETAEALGISTATVKRDWKVARLWLYREVQQGP